MNRFKKAIVWGCQLHQHTNSYVYAAFFKAFKAMGFDSYWLNEDSDISGLDFADSIFVTEWQHSNRMPKRKDCKYVLHNCDPKDYDGLSVLHLQTYTDACVNGSCVHNQDGGKLAHPGLPTKLNNQGSWFLSGNGRNTLFQPWATDLLPGEIDLDWAAASRANEVHWVGTVGEKPYPEDIYSNLNEINAFRRACSENGVAFLVHGPGSCCFEENKRLVQRSLVAPAIHGAEQCRVGYIACRVFKNISYGQMGATNCAAANELFDGNLIYNSDPYRLFYDVLAKNNQKATRDLMQIVKDRHTYVNRINSILEVI